MTQVLMAMRIAHLALQRNPLRSTLTMLGVIIGVAAVIAMLAIGQGAQAVIRAQIASLGSHSLIVQPGSTSQSGVRYGWGSRTTLRAPDVQAILKECPAIAYATPSLRGGFHVVYAILAAAGSSAELPQAIEQITGLLRQRHRLQPWQENDFSIQPLADMAAAEEESTRVMTLLLGSIASISLLVGGIGIMNIMLVSVTERTREIGIRLAVGAKQKDILWQFLVEALTLSLSGGVVGIVLGLAGSQLVSTTAGWPLLISWNAMALAFAFSGAVGIFFGFYPARKAAQLDPIQALRYE